MELKVLMPAGVFVEVRNVTRIVAETQRGYHGLLPARLDCVAALVPGVLMYATAEAGEVFIAVDEGILVKTGSAVLVTVRNAVGGTDLGQLHEAVEEDFLALDEKEMQVRTVLTRMELGFLRRLEELHNA